MTFKNMENLKSVKLSIDNALLNHENDENELPGSIESDLWDALCYMSSTIEEVIDFAKADE